MISIRHIIANHGLLRAVKDVSFTMGRGEVIGVIGSNGAGKTTLFRTICGIHPAISGSIELYGNDISRLPAHQRVKEGIAMVPEGRRLFVDMTVKENLIIAGENGRKGKWTLDKVTEAFPILRNLLGIPAGGLSGGQQQTVAIARALMCNPAVLLLDEISLGLSPVAVETLYQSLFKLREKRDTALLVVEQDLDRAMSFADRIICMLEGSIVLEGEPGGLGKDRVTQAYFGLKKNEVQHD